jgi:Domain of unknown function (DUF4274)
MALSQAQKDRVQALVYDEYVVCSDDEETEADREATRAAFEVLMSQIESPEELHAYASQFNWDGGCNEMRGVIRHPLCDMGTALLIYWHAGAGYYLQYADRSEVREGELEQLELMEEIERRVQDQRFNTATQPFDPRNDMGTDLTTLYEDLAKALKLRNKVPFHPIPSVMYQPVTGE